MIQNGSSNSIIINKAHAFQNYTASTTANVWWGADGGGSLPTAELSDREWLDEEIAEICELAA